MNKTNDLITPMVRRRDALILEKENLTMAYHGKMACLDKEIAHINSTIHAASRLMDAYTCPTCHGTGQERQYDSGDDMSEFTCWQCHGTGIFFEKEANDETDNK